MPDSKRVVHRGRVCYGNPDDTDWRKRIRNKTNTAGLDVFGSCYQPTADISHPTTIISKTTTTASSPNAAATEGIG